MKEALGAPHEESTTKEEKMIIAKASEDSKPKEAFDSPEFSSVLQSSDVVSQESIPWFAESEKHEEYVVESKKSQDADKVDQQSEFLYNAGDGPASMDVSTTKILASDEADLVTDEEHPWEPETKVTAIPEEDFTPLAINPQVTAATEVTKDIKAVDSTDKTQECYCTPRNEGEAMTASSETTECEQPQVLLRDEDGKVEVEDTPVVHVTSSCAEMGIEHALLKPVSDVGFEFKDSNECGMTANIESKGEDRTEKVECSLQESVSSEPAQEYAAEPVFEGSEEKTTVVGGVTSKDEEGSVQVDAATTNEDRQGSLEELPSDPVMGGEKILKEPVTGETSSITDLKTEEKNFEDVLPILEQRDGRVIQADECDVKLAAEAVETNPVLDETCEINERVEQALVPETDEGKGGLECLTDEHGGRSNEKETEESAVAEPKQEIVEGHPTAEERDPSISVQGSYANLDTQDVEVNSALEETDKSKEKIEQVELAAVGNGERGPEELLIEKAVINNEVSKGAEECVVAHLKEESSEGLPTVEDNDQSSIHALESDATSVTEDVEPKPPLDEASASTQEAEQVEVAATNDEKRGLEELSVEHLESSNEGLDETNTAESAVSEMEESNEKETEESAVAEPKEEIVEGHPTAEERDPSISVQGSYANLGTQDVEVNSALEETDKNNEKIEQVELAAAGNGERGPEELLIEKSVINNEVLQESKGAEECVVAHLKEESSEGLPTVEDNDQSSIHALESDATSVTEDVEPKPPLDEASANTQEAEQVEVAATNDEKRGLEELSVEHLESSNEGLDEPKDSAETASVSEMEESVLSYTDPLLEGRDPSTSRVTECDADLPIKDETMSALDEKVQDAARSDGTLCVEQPPIEHVMTDDEALKEPNENEEFSVVTSKAMDNNVENDCPTVEESKPISTTESQEPIEDEQQKATIKEPADNKEVEQVQVAATDDRKLGLEEIPIEHATKKDEEKLEADEPKGDEETTDVSCPHVEERDLSTIEVQEPDTKQTVLDVEPKATFEEIAHNEIRIDEVQAVATDCCTQTLEEPLIEHVMSRDEAVEEMNAVNATAMTELQPEVKSDDGCSPVENSDASTSQDSDPKPAFEYVQASVPLDTTNNEEKGEQLQADAAYDGNEHVERQLIERIVNPDPLLETSKPNEEARIEPTPEQECVKEDCSTVEEGDICTTQAQEPSIMPTLEDVETKFSCSEIISEDKIVEQMQVATRDEDGKETIEEPAFEHAANSDSVVVKSIDREDDLTNVPSGEKVHEYDDASGVQDVATTNRLDEITSENAEKREVLEKLRDTNSIEILESDGEGVTDDGEVKAASDAVNESKMSELSEEIFENKENSEEHVVSGDGVPEKLRDISTGELLESGVEQNMDNGEVKAICEDGNKSEQIVEQAIAAATDGDESGIVEHPVADLAICDNLLSDNMVSEEPKASDNLVSEEPKATVDAIAKPNSDENTNKGSFSGEEDGSTSKEQECDTITAAQRNAASELEDDVEHVQAAVIHENDAGNSDNLNMEDAKLSIEKPLMEAVVNDDFIIKDTMDPPSKLEATDAAKDQLAT
ncbi:hypothetical protein KP509_37G060700 [Ceratopteris richardii]|nr:hypothetical protein KP509_37G060700 [Ceratopteris richardii]